MLSQPFHATFRMGRKIVIGALGGSVVLVGVAMLVLPGPAIVVIPAGLAILGAEFAWARHLLRVARERGAGAIEALRSSRREVSTTRPS